MILHSFKSWWMRCNGQDSSTESRTRAGVQPRLETLEERQVPAVVNEVFLSSLYQGALDRPPDILGQAVFVPTLDAGAPRLDVANALLSSAEYRSLQVRDLYESLLGREPDTFGGSFFFHFLETNSLDEARAIIFSSDEFFINSGGSPVGFVNALFQEVLNRPPTPAERTVENLALEAAGSRQAVAEQVLASPEADALAVTSFFRGVLGRNPDSFGLGFFADRLGAGVPEEQVLADLLASDEFFGLVNETVANQAFADPNLTAQNLLVEINQLGIVLSGFPILDPFGPVSLTPAGVPFGPAPIGTLSGTGITNPSLITATTPTTVSTPTALGFVPSATTTLATVLTQPGLTATPTALGFVPSATTTLATVLTQPGLTATPTALGFVPSATTTPAMVLTQPGLTATPTALGFVPSTAPGTVLPGQTTLVATQTIGLNFFATPFNQGINALLVNVL
jgi:hypothetical protein